MAALTAEHRIHPAGPQAGIPRNAKWGQISILIFNTSAAFLNFVRNPEPTLSIFSKREIAALTAEYSISPVL